MVTAGDIGKRSGIFVNSPCSFCRFITLRASSKRGFVGPGSRSSGLCRASTVVCLHMHVSIYTYMHICMYVYIYVFMYMYMYMYIYMYTSAHISRAYAHKRTHSCVHTHLIQQPQNSWPPCLSPAIADPAVAVLPRSCGRTIAAGWRASMLSV